MVRVNFDCFARNADLRTVGLMICNFPLIKRRSAKLFEPLRTREKIGYGRDMPLEAAHRGDFALVERLGDSPQCESLRARRIDGYGAQVVGLSTHSPVPIGKTPVLAPGSRIGI